MPTNPAGNTSSPYSIDFISLFGTDTDMDTNNNNMDKDANSKSTDNTTSKNIVNNADIINDQHIISNSLNFSPDFNETPDLLLEQLAYLDNFIPSMENTNSIQVSKWMGDNNMNNDSTNHMESNITKNNINGSTLSFLEDERLAFELGAFANDTFIFPDEEKINNNNDNNNNNNNNNTESDNIHDSTNNIHNNLQQGDGPSKPITGANRHYLSQKRNHLLESQYDRYKSRCSSKRQKPNNTSFSESITAMNNSPDDTNIFQISDIQGNSKATKISPISTVTSKDSYLFSSSSLSIPRSISTLSNIELPDYSKISTSTLVSTLPKVAIPPSAFNSLLLAGFKPDQIYAISAIMAYHQKQQQNHLNGTNSPSSSSTTAFSSPNNSQNNNTNNNNIGLLLNLLSGTNTNNNHANNKKPSVKIQNNVIRTKGNNSFDSTKETLGKYNEIHKFEELEGDSSSNDDDHDDDEEEEEEDDDPNFTFDAATLASIFELDIKKKSESKQAIKVEATQELQVSVKVDREQQLKSIKLEEELPLNDVKIPRTEYEDKKIKEINPHEKRKLRENELKSSIDDLNELSLKLQDRIHKLETENKVLQKLVKASGNINEI
ncbi:uncharacterized protein NDAI_0B04210 [Naumovozyma dairenensis CBS 421]|uniref:BZIP domain-containing protein n=1 Tax=Naumovozyma dairenensis (strain ATCC 10597 / BCRC 20456 / CBS 421 / NBRC 0211 / NRRL Y-12639) TaxID=1071378 RepID=G0W6P4_NAUDC|nr:hypothetical protein NDAI_0B04210 [Naumovozyma dairenensis CBS 421]CCD23455.1 hypothetical protein NDAI_0B04210 [Naumovozyma dairenensis CBS 421]